MNQKPQKMRKNIVKLVNFTIFRQFQNQENVFLILEMSLILHYIFMIRQHHQLNFIF